MNNAIAVLHATYELPGRTTFPGTSTLLPSRTTSYDTGTVTWSGTLAGPLVSSSVEIRVADHGDRHRSEPDRTRDDADVTRKTTAIVPVVIPTTSPASATGPLNFLYSGADMWLQNSVHVRRPST